MPLRGRLGVTIPQPGFTMTDDRQISLDSLRSRLQVGDLVFVRVLPRPFRQVAEATGSWTNHVGIVVESCGERAILAESKFPLSRLTPFSSFARRSEQGRVAVLRLTTPLTGEQRARLRRAAPEYPLRYRLQSSFAPPVLLTFCTRGDRRSNRYLPWRGGDLYRVAQSPPAHQSSFLEAVVLRQDTLGTRDGGAGKPAGESASGNRLQRFHHPRPARCTAFAAELSSCSPSFWPHL